MKIDQITMSSLTDSFVESFEYLGLKDFKIMVLNDSTTPGVELVLRKFLPLKCEGNSVLEDLLNPLIDGVKYSDAALDSVKEIKREFKGAKDTIKMLEDKIAELIPYEHYYKLAVKLSKGSTK